VVGLARGALADQGGDAWLEERVASLLASTEARVMRRIDGIGKSVNVREFVRGIAVNGDDAKAALDRAGVVGDVAALLVDVEIRGSGSVKIAEVVEAITGDAELPHRAVRVAMGAWKDGAIASPLDLDAVRKSHGGQSTAVSPQPDEVAALSD
jgi:hypothetical protein